MINSLAELDRVRDECRKLVTQRSMLSAGVSAMPLPGVDIFTDVANITTMLKKISSKFQVDHESVARMDPVVGDSLMKTAVTVGNDMIGKKITDQLVVALLKRIGIRVAAKSVARYIPIIGAVISGTVSFTAMKLIGNGFVNDCYDVARALIDQGDRTEQAA